MSQKKLDKKKRKAKIRSAERKLRKANVEKPRSVFMTGQNPHDVSSTGFP